MLPLPGPPPEPGAVGIRTDLWTRLNDERLARGLPVLAWNGKLSDWATAWSKEMARTGSLHHSDIGALLGLYNYVGENVGVGSGVAGKLHVAFMSSQVHRDDMLTPGFTSSGIGVFCSGGKFWVTVEFARKASEGVPPPFAGGTAPTPVARPDAGSARC